MGTLTEEDLRELYRLMYLTRSVEERLERMVKQGETVGNLYRSLGEEATAVGSAFALRDGDWLCPAIRDLGALFARGLPPREIFLQYTGRGGGGTQGKDTTTHFTIPELGLLGPVSPLGDQLCVLNGIALAFRKRGETRACMAFLSEGATRTGASHEGINFAAVQRLPMVIVVHHNRWAFSTPSAAEGALDDWSDLAGTYGLPVWHVDGNDVLEVYDAASAAVEHARGGEGAAMVVAETFRRLGHAQHDPQPYVDEEELERWRERDPVDRFHAYLGEHDLASPEELARLRERVDRQVEEAADRALSESRPRGREARTRVYAEGADRGRGAGHRGSAAVPWTRREVVGYPDLPAGVSGWKATEIDESEAGG
jgi:pyruvate dehydrogenase E1 component alpha subunit/2-oxoisovalerate dehydrogenase E1 component alpha subunit